MTAPLILAIDPGPTQSGLVKFDGKRAVFADVLPNDDVLKILADDRSDVLAIEQFVATNQPLGHESIWTIHWGGRFHQASGDPSAVMLLSRYQVKKALGLSQRNDDADVSRRLRELIGEKGTKAAPGPTYGVASHAWAALAVGYAAWKQILGN